MNSRASFQPIVGFRAWSQVFRNETECSKSITFKDVASGNGGESTGTAENSSLMLLNCCPFVDTCTGKLLLLCNSLANHTLKLSNQ